MYERDGSISIIKNMDRQSRQLPVKIRSITHKELDKVHDELDTFENLDEQYDLYTLTVRTDWDDTQNRPYEGDRIKEKRRVYLHLYYNVDQTAEDQKRFDRKLMRHHHELETGKRLPECM